MSMQMFGIGLGVVLAMMSVVGLAQEVPSTPGVPVAAAVGARGKTVRIVADPNNAYMQPTEPTPLTTKMPPNSVPANMTPKQPSPVHNP